VDIQYLMNQPWSSWSREERLFCAVLYEHGRRQPRDFAHWLIDASSLGVSAEGDWDIGYEVCLYRDFLWQKGDLAASRQEFPQKRTFDLCLFGQSSLIIVEAKVCERFDSAQNSSFSDDRLHIKRLLGVEDLSVKIVALASSKYFENAKKYSPHALDVFDGQVSWAHAAQAYNDPLLAQAELMYKAKPGGLLIR
jgi:hypothetical protein